MTVAVVLSGIDLCLAVGGIMSEIDLSLAVAVAAGIMSVAGLWMAISLLLGRKSRDWRSRDLPGSPEEHLPDNRDGATELDELEEFEEDDEGYERGGGGAASPTAPPQVPTPSRSRPTAPPPVPSSRGLDLTAVKPYMAILLTIVCGGISLWYLIKDDSTDDDRKASWAMLSGLVGFWLGVGAS